MITGEREGIKLYLLSTYYEHLLGLPWWLTGKEFACPVLDTRIRSLGWEDPLEKEMATHSSILPWEIPWTEEPDGLPWDRKESGTIW